MPIKPIVVTTVGAASAAVEEDAADVANAATLRLEAPRRAVMDATAGAIVKAAKAVKLRKVGKVARAEKVARGATARLAATAVARNARSAVPVK